MVNSLLAGVTLRDLIDIEQTADPMRAADRTRLAHDASSMMNIPVAAVEGATAVAEVDPIQPQLQPIHPFNMTDFVNQCTALELTRYYY